MHRNNGRETVASPGGKNTTNLKSHLKATPPCNLYHGKLTQR